MLVSTHPDAIQRLGTKDVLFETRDLPFGSDVHGIESPAQLAAELAEGMVRAYLVGNRVAGFGHQAINALHPDHALPGPRLYRGPEWAAFQGLRQRLETQWIEQLRQRVGLARDDLPLLWDCDFMHGEPRAGDADPFVLCEINVSSVTPFPPSAIEPLVAATVGRLHGRIDPERPAAA